MTQRTISSPKVALITGAAERLGKAIATELHQRGLKVVIHCSNSLASAKQLSDRFNAIRKNSALVIQQDLTQSASARILIEKTIAAFGQLDYLVNNAAIFFATPFFAKQGVDKSGSLDSFLTINTKRPMQLMKIAYPYLKKQRGAVVNIIDIYSNAGLADHCDYVASKALLWQATKHAAQRFSPNIRVNAVSPGAILWPEKTDIAISQMQNDIIEHTALKRQGCALDISKTVAYLLLDASYSTGSLINVDGGRRLYI